MLMNSGDNTHRPRAMDPKAFRAQATGIGQQASASLQTGTMRAQQVVDSMTPAQHAAVPQAEGYPDKSPDFATVLGVTATPAPSYSGSGRGKLR